MTKKSVATKIAWQSMGLPYKWGGDDPLAGFDCSGFVIELLKSVGILPREGDWTADNLWKKFQDKRTSLPREGCLVFWNNVDATKVIHVEYCISDELAIGAGGGGSHTITVQDAINQNAYIKIRPFRSRGNIAGFVDPFA